MNYIKQLEAEVRALKNEKAVVVEQITELAVYLGSEKFQGVDAKGERKDWVSSREIVAHLMSMRSNHL
jgi:hypothetical protein